MISKSTKKSCLRFNASRIKNMVDSRLTRRCFAIFLAAGVHAFPVEEIAQGSIMTADVVIVVVVVEEEQYWW